MVEKHSQFILCKPFIYLSFHLHKKLFVHFSPKRFSLQMRCIWPISFLWPFPISCLLLFPSLSLGFNIDLQRWEWARFREMEREKDRERKENEETQRKGTKNEMLLLSSACLASAGQTTSSPHSVFSFLSPFL